jgi:hypothetical protein
MPGMTGRQMFTSRLRGRPLLDSEGLTIGRIRDVVILPSDGNDPPRALGLIVTLQRRRIFVNLGQVTEISVDGARLLGGAGELDRFIRRAGEMLASELYGRRTEDGTIVDVAVSPSKYQRPGDEELADLLEEMPEQDQVRLLAGVGLERSADVVEEMQPDDAADLLAELPAEQRERLLTTMESVQAEDLRRLLRYGPRTAGGLMTSQPLIVTPDTPVAEVLAPVRDPDLPVTAAAQVYVCETPAERQTMAPTAITRRYR